MKSKVVYEYLVTKDWFGSLEKGCRLYYDHTRGGYVYHTETENTYKSDKYVSTETSESDYFISIDVAENYIKREALIPGPELGELVMSE